MTFKQRFIFIAISSIVLFSGSALSFKIRFINLHFKKCGKPAFAMEIPIVEKKGPTGPELHQEFYSHAYPKMSFEDAEKQVKNASPQEKTSWNKLAEDISLRANGGETDYPEIELCEKAPECAEHPQYCSGQIQRDMQSKKYLTIILDKNGQNQGVICICKEKPADGTTLLRDFAQAFIGLKDQGDADVNKRNAEKILAALMNVTGIDPQPQWDAIADELNLVPPDAAYATIHFSSDSNHTSLRWSDLPETLIHTNSNSGPNANE